MHDNKLKVRIQIQQPRPADTSRPTADQERKSFSTDVDEQYKIDKPPFDWYKISLALFLLITILGGISYLLLNWDSNERDEDASRAYSEPEMLADLPTRFNYFDDVESAISETGPQIDNVVSVQKNRGADQPEMIKNETNDTVDKLDHERTARLDNGSAITPRWKPESKIKLMRPFPVMKPESFFLENSLAKSQSAATNLITLKLDATDHPNVVRAQLSHAVRQHEPIDEINFVQLEQSGSTSIYFFAELQNLSGQQVAVKWYFEDRLVADTRLYIGSENWRTYATKVLNRQYIGSWRVVLMDQAGNQLAERHFNVRSPM